jgi:hypothetical protein
MCAAWQLSGERLQGVAGDGVEDVAGIAEPPGEVAAHREVAGAVRLLRGLLVDGLDAALEIRDVEPFGGRGRHSMSPHIFKRILEDVGTARSPCQRAGRPDRTLISTAGSTCPGAPGSS